MADKESMVLVYTGEGKGKTSASVGLLGRALGAGKKVAFVQFIKAWTVSEHHFFDAIMPVYKDTFTFHKGGRGFFHAGDQSAENVTDDEHLAAARDTYNLALGAASSGDYDLVICDEINNAVHDGLLTIDDLKRLIERRAPSTSLCLTGRNFPEELLGIVDIATEMRKIKHHYDDGFLATKGIDY
ncbi:cob(I)yrinic acid a,c-diamide adenosyltransferase [Candidatus Saccharibacteria bacterium]|jgi:cob(I)alamin adenosyltransferase|nr:MAG: cob(I)yrinic acid a,c-diamide adenosyltransferase [Candidatus Saccharibacteria bacterium]